MRHRKGFSPSCSSPRPCSASRSRPVPTRRRTLGPAGSHVQRQPRRRPAGLTRPASRTAASVVGSGHWVEVGGQRTPLLNVRGGSGTVLVPAFLTGDAMWPVVAQEAVDVEVHGPNGLVAAATGAFTVQPLRAAPRSSRSRAYRCIAHCCRPASRCTARRTGWRSAPTPRCAGASPRSTHAAA